MNEHRFAFNRRRISKELYPFYLEIKDRFTLNNEKVIDSSGRRWLRCKHCGFVLPQGAFMKFNVDGHLNLGVCIMCYHKSESETKGEENGNCN